MGNQQFKKLPPVFKTFVYEYYKNGKYLKEEELIQKLKEDSGGDIRSWIRTKLDEKIKQVGKPNDIYDSLALQHYQFLQNYLEDGDIYTVLPMSTKPLDFTKPGAMMAFVSIISAGLQKLDIIHEDMSTVLKQSGIHTRVDSLYKYYTYCKDIEKSDFLNNYKFEQLLDVLIICLTWQRLLTQYGVRIFDGIPHWRDKRPIFPFYTKELTMPEVVVVLLQLHVHISAGIQDIGKNGDIKYKIFACIHKAIDSSIDSFQTVQDIPSCSCRCDTHPITSYCTGCECLTDQLDRFSTVRNGIVMNGDLSIRQVVYDTFKKISKSIYNYGIRNELDSHLIFINNFVTFIKSRNLKNVYIMGLEQLLEREKSKIKEVEKGAINL
jgi:hypothetical protein